MEELQVAAMEAGGSRPGVCDGRGSGWPFIGTRDGGTAAKGEVD